MRTGYPRKIGSQPSRMIEKTTRRVCCSGLNFFPYMDLTLVRLTPACVGGIYRAATEAMVAVRYSVQWKYEKSPEQREKERK